MAPSAAASAPLVFYIHGYGSNKESGLTIAYQLARAGCFVVSFDAWGHGERFDDCIFRAAEPELGGVYPPETGLFAPKEEVADRPDIVDKRRHRPPELAPANVLR